VNASLFTRLLVGHFLFQILYLFIYLFIYLFSPGFYDISSVMHSLCNIKCAGKEDVWKDVVMTFLKVLSSHSAQGAGKTINISGDLLLISQMMTI